MTPLECYKYHILGGNIMSYNKLVRDNIPNKKIMDKYQLQEY